MNTERLPWEIVETFPSTDDALIARWEHAVESADDDRELTRSLIGHALSLYWATQEGLVDDAWEDVAAQRTADLHRALELARLDGDPDLVAEALLGALYGTWGPDGLLDRDPIIAELSLQRFEVTDEEVRLRIIEWEVLQHLDRGELDAARSAIDDFARTAADTELVLFRRREVLWRGCLAMLDGELDEALRINQDAISSTANVAGSPFSFQNVAITLAIERYLRRGLGDTVDAIRSIRASSPWSAPTGTRVWRSRCRRSVNSTRRVRCRGAGSRSVRSGAAGPELVGHDATARLDRVPAIDADDHGPVLIELLGTLRPSRRHPRFRLRVRRPGRAGRRFPHGSVGRPGPRRARASRCLVTGRRGRGPQ